MFVFLFVGVLVGLAVGYAIGRSRPTVEVVEKEVAKKGLVFKAEELAERDYTLFVNTLRLGHIVFKEKRLDVQPDAEHGLVAGRWEGGLFYGAFALNPMDGLIPLFEMRQQPQITEPVMSYSDEEYIP